MKKIAVILSGCGVFDGSEIHESVLTLLALDRAGAQAVCFAPNINQTQVTNHLTHAVMPETRNVLVEAARIARGKIADIRQANISELSGAIYPGGFGAALNLSDFGTQGSACHINADVLAFSQAMQKAKKPQAFICIAPALVNKIYGGGVTVTVGDDAATAEMINKMGGTHVACRVENIVADDKHRVVTTPAYMLAHSIKDAAAGIEKSVAQLLAWC